MLIIMIHDDHAPKKNRLEISMASLPTPCFEALEACVKLANQFIADRCLPDKVRAFLLGLFRLESLEMSLLEWPCCNL